MEEKINEVNLLKEEEKQNNKDTKKLKRYTKISKIGAIVTPVLAFFGYTLSGYSNPDILLYSVIGAETLFITANLSSKVLYERKLARSFELSKEIHDKEDVIDKEEELKKAKTKVEKYENQNTLSYNYGENYSLNNDIGYSRRRRFK